MDTHIKVVGWLYIVLGVMGILAALVVFAIVFGGGLISGDRTAITVTGLVATIIAGLITLISLPGIITGIGLLSFKPWARILAIVLGILNLPGFPVGTVVGVYAIWAMLDDDSNQYFIQTAS